MKKITLLFLTIFAFGLLGSTQPDAQKNSKYVLKDDGYYTTINGKLEIVPTKDVSWYIRFNPSSTLAGVVDNRTSAFRRFKKAAVAATVGVAGLLSAYQIRKNYQNKQEENKLNKGINNIVEKVSAAISSAGAFLNIAIMGGKIGASTNAKLTMMEGRMGSIFRSLFGPTAMSLFYIWSSQEATYKLAKIFSSSMKKRTEHLDRNLQLNVVEAAF